MKNFLRKFLRGIGVATTFICFDAAVICFVLTAIGVLMALMGEITWKVLPILVVADIVLGATYYAINETL